MSKALRDYYARVVRLDSILNRVADKLAVLDGMEEFSETASDRDYPLPPGHEHKSLLRAYNNFFDPVRDALLLDAHIQLAKLLIDNDDSLHVKKLVRQIRSQDSKIRKDQQRADFDESIADFASWYRALSPDELDQIALKFEVNEWLVNKLELVRNKRLTHENLREVPAKMLTLEELHKLADLADFVLGCARLVIGSVNFEEHDHEKAKRETKFLLEKLYSTY